MRIKLFVGTALVVLILAAVSCEKNAVKVGGLPVDCDTTKVKPTYSGEMDTIINTNCANSVSCHAAGGASVNFSTYNGLRADATGGQSSKMWSYLFILKTMPLAPQPPLDICTKAKFMAWLNAGAPK